MIAVAPVVTANPQGYYRWKDDKGQFQATQQPPKDRPSEFVRTSTGTASQSADDNTPSQGSNAGGGGTPGKSAGNDGAAKSNKSIEGIPEKDPEKCKQAQDTQAVLNSHARIREKDDKGEYRYLTPEEITDQKKLAGESIDIFCDPSGEAK